MTEILPPPGLVGDVARFIRNAAPRPVSEIALVGAIGLIAGIAGRSYNVSGTGLNQYALLLANTGTGKEAMNRGISRIVSALADPTKPHYVELARTFVGPADMASGPGLLKCLDKRTPCFVSLIGEFGLRFKQMADERNSADTSLLRTMLDLYNKSGHGDFIGETVYSKKEDGTRVIKSPAITLIGESTPETFFANLNEQMITNGLLPRFTIVEYTGPRPSRNRDAESVVPNIDMLARLAGLMRRSLTANVLDQVTNVGMSPDAEAYLDALDVRADDEINGAKDSVTKELWNRAHMKAVKLAALIAVGCDYDEPVITLEMAVWATAQIERDIHRLIVRFESGDIGAVAGNELKQQEEVRRVIAEFNSAPFEKYEKLGGIKEMHAIGVFTHGYLQRRLLPLPIFKLDPIKATPALKRAMTNLESFGEIETIPQHFVWSTFGKKWLCYRIAVENDKSWIANVRGSPFRGLFPDEPIEPFV
ncbi:MAG: DUF3987 domain-containing protein [Sphingomonas bacterium]